MVFLGAALSGNLSCGGLSPAVPGADPGNEQTGPDGPDVSPPAPIPSPVSGLITISAPDQFGNILINGTPGAAVPGAIIFAANVTKGGVVYRLKNFFLRVAYAQTAGITANTVVNGDGSFALQLFAEIGDIIQIVQEVDGVRGPVLELPVPENTLALEIQPQALNIHGGQEQVYITGGTGEAGCVYALPLGDEPIVSFPPAAFKVDATGIVDELVLDPDHGIGWGISREDLALIGFDLEGKGESKVFATELPPVGLEAAPDFGGVFLGVASEKASLQLFRPDKGAFECMILLNHPSQKTTASRNLVDSIAA